MPRASVLNTIYDESMYSNYWVLLCSTSSNYLVRAIVSATMVSSMNLLYRYYLQLKINFLVKSVTEKH